MSSQGTTPTPLWVPVTHHPCFLLRFGIALAKLRSAHAQRTRSEALEVIKENVKKYKKIPRAVRKDSAWIKHAQLQSIFDFIA